MSYCHTVQDLAVVPLPLCDSDDEVSSDTESSSDESGDGCTELSERTVKVNTNSKPGAIVEM